MHVLDIWLRALGKQGMCVERINLQISLFAKRL